MHSDIANSAAATGASALRLVVVSTFYPNQSMPQRTMFVRNLVLAMAKRCVVLGVVAPVPYAPPVGSFSRWRLLRSVPSEEVNAGLPVSHPRFIAIPGLQVLNGLAYGVRLMASLWRIKRRHGKFMVHGHCAYPDGVGVALAAGCLGIPYAITAHGSDLNIYAERRLLRPQVRWALRGAAGVIAVSHSLCERVRQLTQSALPTTHIPCAGFDPTVFTPRDVLRPSSAPAMGRSVVFVGHLVPIKGVNHLIAAWAHLSRQGAINQDDRLTIVGEGPERTALTALAASIAQNQIEFTGALPPAEVAQRIHSADLLCLPSLHEGTPNVVVEALACGVPVVASRVGGIPDLVRDGINGWLVPAGDSAALAEALSGVLGRAWVPAAICKSVEHLTWQSLATRNLAFLNDLDTVRA